MKRIGNLFEKIATFENLYQAFLKSKKGTKNYESYKFYFNYENEIIELQKQLIEKTYLPKKYSYFLIQEPKERIISVASFRDRVVHHAIVNILEPIYEKSFIFDSYATRKNKGTHKAIKKSQEYLKNNKWYFKSDISKYFENINHEILLQILGRKIKDQKLLDLIEKIIRNHSIQNKGLPIGNLTSQFFANVYLDSFDHFIKEQLKQKYYIRYMDDFVIFSNSKEELKKIREKIKTYLFEQLNLILKEKATYINQRNNGLTFLGARVFESTIRINPENLKRSLKKLNLRKKEFKNNKITEEKFLQCSNSVYIGNLGFFNTFNLRRSDQRKSKKM